MPPATPAAAGSGRSELWKRSSHPLARSAKATPCSSFPASAGPVPRSLTRKPTTEPHEAEHSEEAPLSSTGGSGIGPERALEAITPPPRAQRESDPLSELPCERRPGPAEPHRAHRTPSENPPEPLWPYASNGLMTSPAMSVRRKSRPSNRWVRRVCSIPSRWSIVACRSCTFTGSSTML
ncbi:MAG: hypothetical protein RL768_2831 [Nitrospirota bacterium]